MGRGLQAWSFLGGEQLHERLTCKAGKSRSCVSIRMCMRRALGASFCVATARWLEARQHGKPFFFSFFFFFSFSFPPLLPPL